LTAASPVPEEMTKVPLEESLSDELELRGNEESATRLDEELSVSEELSSSEELCGSEELSPSLLGSVLLQLIKNAVAISAVTVGRELWRGKI